MNTTKPTPTEIAKLIGRQTTNPATRYVPIESVCAGMKLAGQFEIARVERFQGYADRVISAYGTRIRAEAYCNEARFFGPAGERSAPYPWNSLVEIEVGT